MAYRKVNIDFSNLPIYENGKIKWCDCVGKIVQYTIEKTDHYGCIKIEEVYDNKLKIKIDDNNSIIIYKNSFRNCNIAKELKEKAKIFKYSVGQELKDLLILKQILITKKVSINNKKVDSIENGYLVRCLRDGYEFEVLEKFLNRRRNCPICGNSKVIIGINDMKTTDPEFSKWVANKEDARTYSRNSNKEILLRCPVCGRTFTGIPNRYKSVPSCICNDHVSYPEKFMSSVLNQLQVNYIHQLSNSTFKWCKTYKYDFYFKYNSKEYIVEMDGAFHYTNNYKSNTLQEDAKKTDDIKDKLAEENNCIMIRINSNYLDIRNRHKFIKENIINSYLSDIFDLSNIDWEECEKFCITSLVKTVSDLWNDSLSNIEIQIKTSLSSGTICDYLKVGRRLGLNNYEPGSRHHISDAEKKYLKVQNTFGDIICIHLGITDFSRKSNQLIGYKIGIHQIFDNLKNKTQNRKGLKFSYATKEEYEDYINKKAS